MSLVLIADDNPHAHRMGRQILSQEGHEVVTVSNGDEALEYLTHNRPDLIMADTRMPGPSGYDVCREVKHSGRFPGVKVVLLAGPLEPFDPELAKSAGSDAVLHKPLDAYSLIETINNLLGDLDTEASAPNVDGLDEPPAPAPGQMEGSFEQLMSEESDGDPFAEVVEQALGRSEPSAGREEKVRAAVLEVLEAALPALVDTITQRVIASLDGQG